MTLSTASCDSEFAPGVAMTTSSSNESVSDVTAGSVFVVAKQPLNAVAAIYYENHAENCTNTLTHTHTWKKN